MRLEILLLTAAVFVGCSEQQIQKKMNPKRNGDDAQYLTELTNIKPVLFCVYHDELTLQNVAYFGYDSEVAQSVDVGAENMFSPGSADAGQGTAFSAGVKKIHLGVKMAGSQLSWKLGSETVTADASNMAQRCVIDTSVPVGPVGLKGPQGLQGLAGIEGIVGVPGPLGPVGVDGVKGPVGDTGPKGPIGNAGAAGAKGPNGDTGAQGLMGPAGIQGLPGDSFSKSVDTCRSVLKKQIFTKTAASYAVTAECKANERLVNGGGTCTLSRMLQSEPVSNKSWKVACEKKTAVVARILCCPI